MHRIAIEDRDGQPVAVLESQQLRASFAVTSGMTCRSLEHAGEELLGPAGIPFLHPWANRLTGLGYRVNGTRVALDPARQPLRFDDGGLPIHGLLWDDSRWALRRLAAAGEARLLARFEFCADEDLLSAFPFPHVLTLEAALRGGELTVRTRVTAAGAGPVPIAFGFHPYLRLPGVPRADWEVELPARRHLALDARSLPTGAERAEPAFAGRLGDAVFDDLYGVAPPARFALAGGGRRIEARFDARYPFAQVFAPASEDVICFEPMTAPVAALNSPGAYALLAPERTYAASFSLAVTEL